MMSKTNHILDCVDISTRCATNLKEPQSPCSVQQQAIAFTSSISDRSNHGPRTVACTIANTTLNSSMKSKRNNSSFDQLSYATKVNKFSQQTSRMDHSLPKKML